LASVAWLRARSEDCRRKADRIQSYLDAKIAEAKRRREAASAAQATTVKRTIIRKKWDGRGKRILKKAAPRRDEGELTASSPSGWSPQGALPAALARAV
jgi:hypothetical protein